MKKQVLVSIFAACFGIGSQIYAQNGPSSKLYAKQLETQLSCQSNPMAGRFLTLLQRARLISRPYVVVDTVSYFKLRRPLRVWNLSPVAIFGFQKGYTKLFPRGPGTLPPEMIGIVVAETVESAKADLEKLGISGLNVEQADFDTKGKSNESKNLTEISCWEKH